MLQKLYSWYGKKTVWAVIVIFFAIVGYGLMSFLFASEDVVEEVATETLPVVVIAPANSLQGDASVRLVGTVESVDRSVIRSEAAGRIVRTNVSLGDNVQAGQVIAQLENASQQAAVLQAEGAYEQAVASAAQTDLGTGEAENNLQVAENNLESARQNTVSTYRSAYTSANDIVFNQVDTFFSNPGSQIPGLRVNGRGFTNQLNSQRVELQTILPEWRNKSNALTTSDDVTAALNEAEEDLIFIRSMVDAFLQILPQESANNRFSVADLAAAQSGFVAARNVINGQLAAISEAETRLQNAQETLRNAREGLERARIASTEGEVSVAGAQVKQALGSLRAAQANLAKTIIRSPITGTVNQMNARTGDFVSAFQEIAVVANNDAQEITTFVGQNDLNRIAVGDTVLINSVTEGVVSTIAPAIDQATGKVEVVIQTTSEALRTGDTVNISIQSDSAPSTQTDGPLLLPINAVRFTSDAGSVFVIDGDTLVQQPVETGTVRSGFVEIRSGIEPATEIVIDARGLVSGQQVTPIRN